jgi:hypothetical protein
MAVYDLGALYLRYLAFNAPWRKLRIFTPVSSTYSFSVMIFLSTILGLKSHAIHPLSVNSKLVVTSGKVGGNGAGAKRGFRSTYAIKFVI